MFSLILKLSKLSSGKVVSCTGPSTVLPIIFLSISEPNDCLFSCTPPVELILRSVSWRSAGCSYFVWSVIFLSLFRGKSCLRDGLGRKLDSFVSLLEGLEMVGRIPLSITRL